MEHVKLTYDKRGETLTVWFGNPADEYVSEEAGDEVILMKDRAGHVIGIEKLGFNPEERDDAETLEVDVRTVP
jgi:uncharacterized protein YuzE